MHTSYGVFIGRFQPLHNGHLSVIRRALQDNDRLIIVVGSANEPRSIRNMFTSAERERFIMSSIYDELGADYSHRTEIVHQEDIRYNDTAWISSIVGKIASVVVRDGETWEVNLVGYGKDNSSYYLKKFPQWKSINYEPDPHIGVINATDIREMWVEGLWGRIERQVPEAVFYFLKKFPSEELKKVMEEWSFIRKHKEMWSSTPYPVSFNTVDAVVVQSAHVLLIRRRAAPGKGLWALPGGYLDLRETHEESMLRELKEETRIDVPEKVLIGNVKSHRSFAAPNRSDRGRLITEAFLIQLPEGPLPKIKGSDDADKARWVPISELKRCEMFEDHMDIINSMIGRTPK